MAKPRTLKSALEQGYIISKVCFKYDKDLRVDLKERYHKENRVTHLSFWMDRDYFKRTYPNEYMSL